MNTERIFVPKRLTEARLAAGLSRTSLADACDLSPQSVSAFETGLRIPAPATLKTMADNLMLPLRYFLSSRACDSSAAGPTFFRSQRSARTRREYDRRAQTAIWAAEVGTWIDKFVSLPAVNLPDLAIENDPDQNAIEDFAAKVREAWGLGCGPIGNLVRLLETKGIAVVRQTFETSKMDAFSRVALGRPYIFLSHNKSSFVRSRFDAAHELGHLLMHQNVTMEDLEESVVLNKIEREANQFAASFLMPASTFASELYGLSLQSFINLKPRWKVSVQAMIFRSHDLGLITETQRSSLMTQIAARGMRVIEPLDQELKVEDPLLFRKAWELIVDENVRPALAIVDDLALRPEFIASVLNVPSQRLIGEVDFSNIIPFRLKALPPPPDDLFDPPAIAG